MEKLERGINAVESRLKGRTWFKTTLDWPWRIHPWHAPCTGDSSLLSTVRCVIPTLTLWDGIRGLRTTMEWKRSLGWLTWLRNVGFRRNSYIAELWYLSRPFHEASNRQSSWLTLRICLHICSPDSMWSWECQNSWKEHHASLLPLMEISSLLRDPLPARGHNIPL